MGKVQDYLRNKKLVEEIGTDTMYYLYSDRTGVEKRIVKIDSVEKGSRRQHNGQTTWTESKRYKFKESPYEMEIYEGDTHGQNDGYASGFGDLWYWSQFCSLDEKVIDELYDKELKRITEKYLNKSQVAE